MIMNLGRKLAVATVAIVAGLAGTAITNPASADFVFDLNKVNTTGFTGPFAQVDVNRTSSTTATITFTSLTNSGLIYLMGASGSVGVNVNGTATLGTVTGSNGGTGFSPGPYSNGGSANEDGFGIFDLTIDSFDGFTHSADTISFGLTNTSGTWASASDVLIGNNDGNLAEAHIFATSSPANARNTNSTFFVSGNGSCTIPGTPGCVTQPPPGVPEPGSLAIMGFGLAALGLALRRRAKTTGLRGRDAA